MPNFPTNIYFFFIIKERELQRFIWQLNFVNIAREFFFLWISACFWFCLNSFFHIVSQRERRFIYYKQLQQHSNICWVSASKTNLNFLFTKSDFIVIDLLFIVYVYSLLFSIDFIKENLFFFIFWFLMFLFLIFHLRKFLLRSRLAAFLHLRQTIFLIAFLFFFFLCNLRDISIF